MAKKKDSDILYVRKGATLREIYAAARAAFTAEDLQKYTVDEPMIPVADLIKELEAINEREKAKTKRKPRKKKK